MSLNMALWLIMLLLLAGLLCCAGAIYLALAAVWPQALAALVAGVVLLGVCTTLALAAWLAVRRRPEPQPAAQESDNSQPVEGSVRAVVGDQAINWARDNTGLAIAGAVAAGAVLGASPGLRRSIMRISRPVAQRAFEQAVKQKSGG